MVRPKLLSDSDYRERPVKNIELNAGGVIGSLACGAITAAIVFSSLDLSRAGRSAAKLVFLALIAGAFAGNFLWGLVFKKSD